LSSVGGFFVDLQLSNASFPASSGDFATLRAGLIGAAPLDASPPGCSKVKHARRVQRLRKSARERGSMWTRRRPLDARGGHSAALRCASVETFGFEVAESVRPRWRKLASGVAVPR